MLNNIFIGGIHIPNPYPVKNPKIVKVPPPEKAVLILQQKVGGQAKPCVEVGDKVLTGQVIAGTSSQYCVPIHASISGTISAIDKQPIPHPSGIDAMCITIESDGKDKWVEKEECGADFLSCKPEQIIDKIRSAGIVGMGGAGFPTHIKVSSVKNANTLVVNATECEPGIMCDDSLMQNYPREIIRGTEILLHACSAKKAIIAIEDDKQEAFNSLLMYNHNDKITIQRIPTKYTSGADKLLIKSLLDVEVPAGKHPSDIGVLCHNVGTVKAIHDAVIDGRPLVSRIVTVTGSGVEDPKNYEARLGTSFASVVSQSKPNKQKHKIRMGGMMMGVDVNSDQYSICKITNCIFINNFEPEPQVNECIRCSSCNQVCPINLLPQQLYWSSKSESIDKALEYNLDNCIECGCCSYVCPSNIPLVDYFVFAKAVNKKQINDAERADIARQRFEYREFRIERNKSERAEMMAKKKKALKEKMAKEKQQKDKIADAIQRVSKSKENKDA